MNLPKDTERKSTNVVLILKFSTNSSFTT